LPAVGESGGSVVRSPDNGSAHARHWWQRISAWTTLAALATERVEMGDSPACSPKPTFVAEAAQNVITAVEWGELKVDAAAKAVTVGWLGSVMDEGR
jgi:hypothetical protein